MYSLNVDETALKTEASAPVAPTSAPNLIQRITHVSGPDNHLIGSPSSTRTHNPLTFILE